jgi:hypothetical protein
VGDEGKELDQKLNPVYTRVGCTGLRRYFKNISKSTVLHPKDVKVCVSSMVYQKWTDKLAYAARPPSIGNLAKSVNF